MAPAEIPNRLNARKDQGAGKSHCSNERFPLTLPSAENALGRTTSLCETNQFEHLDDSPRHVKFPPSVSVGCRSRFRMVIVVPAFTVRPQ